MAIRSVGSVLSWLRRLEPTSLQADQDDGDLLRRFNDGENVAFSTLLGRYAPLVWGVSRRLLRHEQDAEEAFQATFLILVRKAASLSTSRPLGPWLYRVAYRTALKRRQRRARISGIEQNLEYDPVGREGDPVQRKDLCGMIDQEVEQLPERYRQPIVLCYLEGLTNEEAARRLGCPKGTILSRLSRARDHLRERFARRGFEFAGLPALVVPATVPVHLTDTILRAAPLLSADGPSALAPAVLDLAKGVMTGMFYRKLEGLGFLIAALAVVVSGAGLLARWSGPAPTRSALAAPPAKSAEESTRSEAADPERKDVKASREKEKGKPLATPAESISKVVDFPGVEGNSIRLSEMLDTLAKDHGIQIDINEKAFQNTGTNIAEVELGPNLRPLRSTLGVILNKVLARIPAPAMYLIRKDRIEITTESAVRAELGLPDSGENDSPAKPLLPLITMQFRKVAFDKALDELADASGYNMVIDPRVEEKTSAKVSAKFLNVPLDTGLELLADMVGLGVVRKGNVFYITTESNAAKHRKAAAEIPAPLAISPTAQGDK